MNENNKNNFNDSSSISTDGIGPSTKKRKLSMGEISSTNIELEILRSTVEKWKEYAQKLEAEKLQHIDGCNGEKILELEETVKKLQSMNDELNAKNEEEKGQLKAEMESSVNECAAKVKTLEIEKQEIEAKIKELSDEISTMKIIKTEIKDSVENERENYQAETEKLKAEITDVKQENRFLSEANQNLLKIHENEIQNFKLEKEKTEAKMEEERKNFQSTISDGENQRKKIEKKYGETAVANQQLEQKCKNLETTINKNKKEYQSIIGTLKTENQNLSKTNIDLVNDKKALQNSTDEFKEKIKNLEKNESEMQIMALEDAFLDGKINDGLVSCKSNIIINISKLDGSDGSWKLYSTVNQSKSHSLTGEDLCKTCFKLNITDQLLVNLIKLHHIMHKINICELTKLHLSYQTINYIDYQKLVSSKKVEICVLECVTVNLDNNKECNLDDLFKRFPTLDNNKECNLDDLLKHLPNIKEFTYKFYNFESITYNHPTLAKNLGQLEPFFHLQKFEILNLTSKFKIEDFGTFINKHNRDVTYTLTFCDATFKSIQNKIEKAKNRLLKSLPFPCKIKLGFEKD